MRTFQWPKHDVEALFELFRVGALCLLFHVEVRVPSELVLPKG